MQDVDEVEATRRRLMEALRTGVPQNPDQLAQDRAAAAERGVSVQTLRAARDQGLPIPNQNWHALPVTAPRTTNFLSDPTNAAVAHDDVETLARIERNMREYGPNAFSGPMQPAQGDNNILGWMRGIGTSFTEGFALSRTGLQRQLNDYLVGAGIIDAPATDQYGRDQYDWRTRQAQGQMALARPEIENDLARGVYGGLESTARAAPGLALSILLRNPTPSLVATGIQTEGEAYAKYRERGGDAAEATVGAGGEAAVEVLTEMIPMGFLVKNFGKKGALAFVGGVLAREVPGELAATMAQDAIDTAIANPDKTWSEYWAERPDALAQTAIATVTQSLLMGGANAAIGALANRGASAEAQSQRAESGARMVEQLGVLAAASKLNAREAQTFQQFVDMAAEDGDVTDIYIATETLFQSANETDLDLDALAAAVPHVAEQIRSGASDIRMTVGEYTAHVAGTQANAALLDHLRTDPLGMSRADAKEQLANLDATIQQDFDKAFERSAETEAAMASRDVVAGQIAAKLNATGRFTSDVNQRYGMIVANFYSTLGARRGMSAEQMAELIRLDFDAELPGTNQDNTLAQEESVALIHYSSTAGVMTSDPTQWGASRATQNSERERRNAGAPGRTYFGVQGVYQGEPQTGIRSRPFRYKARIPASKLYDFDADPQGLKPTEGTPMEIATAYEKAIQAAGFSGYRSDAMIPGAVAVFDAIGMEQEGPVRTVQDAQRLDARMRELAQQDRLARLAASTDPEENIPTRPAEDFREQALSELFGSSYAQTATVRGGRETLKKFGLDPNKRYSTRQVAAALEARQRAKWGKIDRDDQSPEAAKKIAGWMAEEVMFEMQNPEQSGVGWYSYKFQAALDIFAKEFPELATDQDARDTFTALIAITSDGQKVIPNFQQAVGIYRAMKANGQFVADQGTQRQASVDNNLAKIQEMHDTLGPAAMREFLLGEMTVSELKKKAKESGLAFSSSYKSDVKLPMAAVLFGPKLGAFYANLMGADGYLTMDRWWSRTFNRYRGTILTRAGQPGLDGFKKLIDQPDLSNDEVLVAILAPQRALEARKFKTQLAVLVGKSEPSKAAEKAAWMATARERAGDRFDALLLEHKIERAANTLFKAAFVNLEDQPFNAGDRSFMLEAVALARKSLKRRGVDISVADIQAVLWYYEKRLYGELGARQTADVSYEEAAQRVVDGRPIDAELLGPDLDSDWEDTAEQSDPGLQVFNQGPLPRTVDAYFSPANLGSLLEKDDWAILTAANPQGNEVSAEENEAAMARLAADLEAAGYDFQPSVGRYGQIEPGFTVVGINEKQARELGDRYNQHSVLTHKGVIYQDGHIDVAVGITQYDTRPEDYFTEIPGTGALFQLDIPNWRQGGPQMPAVGTPAFKTWFGNSAVKNEAGDPLVVYHGTPYDFNSFRGDGVLNLFTPNAEHASFFARGAGSTMPVYLSIQNPLEITQQQLEDRLTEEQADDGMLPRDLLEEIVAEAVAAGNDGVIVRDFADLEYTEDLFIPVQPTQIKSTLNRGFFDPQGPNILYQADPFYSALQRAVEQSPLTKAPAAQWKATLAKTAGVKKEEIEWSGINDYLDEITTNGPWAQAPGPEVRMRVPDSYTDDKGNITREAVLGFLRAGGVQLEETVLGGRAQVAEQIVFDEAQGGYALAMFDGTILPGPVFDTREEAEQEAEQDNDTQFITYKLPGADDTYHEILLSLPNIEGPSTHWDKQNVVAHARITGREDAAGKRVLFIEELQSDWHQKGRDQGYQAPYDPVEEAAAREAVSASSAALTEARRPFVAATQAALAQSIAETEDAIRQAEEAGMSESLRDNLREGVNILKDAATNLDSSVSIEAGRGIDRGSDSTLIAENLYRRSQRGDLMMRRDDALKAAYDAMLAAGLAHNENSQRLQNARSPAGIADAPWKKSWDALLMKRMIRYAVDNGFEQIAWINGNQQNGGQTGGDGSFFYERNLVNTTNDIVKKFGTKVGPVDMRDQASQNARDRATGEQVRREVLEGEQLLGDEDRIARAQERLDSYLAENEAQLNRPSNALGIQNGFTITPELRDAAMSGFAMFQQNRGQIAFGRDISQTPSVISLLKTADLSTFLHETGHFFLEATLHLANMPDADAVSVADANILMRWFAPDMTLEKWAGMTLEEKTPYHERFARGFEAYLLEGKAPSTEMRSLFRTFSSWLKSVYKSLTDLNVELTDDVRGVMDRMLASEAEIEDAHQVWALSALYDQKPEGMTEDEWARLQALGRDATEEAVEQLERRSVRDLKWASGAKSRALRQLQDEAEELRKAVRAEVTAEVMAEPVNRARNFLRRGLGEDGEPVEGAAKLDLETLKALYGEEGTWTKLRRGGKYGEVGTDGLHPDIVAGMFGYPSGQALIEDLVNGEIASEKIKGLTDQRMLERHGDLSDPQSVDKAANEAVANEARVKFVAAEEAYAAKAVGKKSLLAEAAKAIADRVVARLTLKNLKPAQYISAQIRASRAARKAAAKGDGVGVATAKRTQLINLHTGRAVSAARKEVEKDLRLFARIVTSKDATLARSRNMDLVNAARAILAKYGVGRVKNDVAGYIKAVQTYDPELYADLASVFGDLVNPERPLNELTYGEYVAVRDAVRQLWQQSRQSKVIEIDGQQRTIESVVGELNAQMDEVQPNADVAAPETTPSKEDRRGHEILGVRAMLRRVESWARGVDVRVQGPFIRYIWNPISEASDRYRRDSAAYMRRLNELMETVRDEMKPRDIAAPELGFVFKSKAVLYHAMLHTGNLSNKTKLLLGWKWGKKNEDGTLDDTQWQAFMDRMHREGVITERDWAFVQSVWDLLEETKPGAQRAHHAMYGRYFNEITADPVVTPFGTLRGGYVPALTESYFVQDAMLRQGEDGLESNSASQMFPSTGNGFTKGREENYTQPLSLELGLLPAHLDKVVKFTHLGPAVRQAMRLLKNRKLAARLKAFDPTAQTDLLLPWLQRAAKQTVEAQGIGNGGKWVDKTARYLRGTVGMQLMFANVINTAQQLVGGPFAAAVRVKPSRLGQALWRFMRNPSEVTTAATNLSTALAVRMDNQIMETRQNINEIIDLDPNALGSARRWAIRHGYFMQSAVQNIMDPIIWTAAFDQATSEGQSTADAVRFADSVLRETQGSWNPEDVSRLETGSPFVRMFTQFGGWANMLANLNATETQIVARGVGVGKGKGRLFYVYLMGFAAQALVGQAIADLMRGGWDDDEEDGYLDEALNWFFSSQLKLGLSSIPIAGPLANVALGGFTEARFDDRLSVSPVLSVVEGGLLAPASVYDSVVNGEKFNRADVRNVLTLLGLVSGLPLLPLAKPLGYAADVANGDVEPTGPLDAARGAITGAPSPGSKTQ